MLTVNVSSTEGGTVRIDQSIPTTFPSTSIIATGTSVSLEAVPALGYEFAGWSGSVTGENNPITTEMTCAKNITANFIQVGAFRLTIDVFGGGSVTPGAGIYGYNKGTVVDITATPNIGNKFDGWTGEVANANSTSTTVTMDSGKTIIANFSWLTYTLIIEVKGSGSVSPSPGDHNCFYGSNVSITATPSPGYQFAGWTGGEVADATSASTTVTVNSDMTVTANFLRIRTLTMAVKGPGSVTPSSGDYAEGTVVNITATPDKDYKFVSWTGNVGNPKLASTTVTIGSNMTVTANFSKIGLSPLLLGVIIGGGALIIVVAAWLLTRKKKTA